MQQIPRRGFRRLAVVATKVNEAFKPVRSRPMASLHLSIQNGAPFDMRISFAAYGTPAPKGSVKVFIPRGSRRPVVTEDNKHTRPWSAQIKIAAQATLEKWDEMPFADGPVALYVLFYMPRPKSLPRRVNYHTKKPDLDKLVRAVKDALTGILWRDDAQVINIVAAKHYVFGRLKPHARIEVYTGGIS